MYRWQSPVRRKASRRQGIAIAVRSAAIGTRQSPPASRRHSDAAPHGSEHLSDDEKARLAREGDQLSRQFQRKQQDSQDDFNEAQREIVDRIGRKMIDILDKYSKERDTV